MRALALGLVFALTACAPALPPAPAARSFAFAIPASAAEPPPPIALDGDDGTSLEIEELAIAVSVHGPLALTKVHAKFVNPTDRRMEGRFRLALPPRSSVASLAMMIGRDWRNASVAESSAARETYEDILHRRRDPLLVEQRREREIAARVAPIEAHEQKEITVSYTSEIGPEHPVVIPLRGLPTVGALEVSIVDGAREPLLIQRVATAPTADVRWALPTTDTLRAGGVEAHRVATVPPTEPDALAHVALLIDTSAAADLSAATELARAIPHDLAIAYDQSAVRLEGEIGAALAARGAYGLADLDAGLRAAAAAGARRVIVIGGADAPATTEYFDRVDVLATTALNDARKLEPTVKNGVLIEDAASFDRALLLDRLAHRATASEHIVYPRPAPSPSDPVLAHAYAAHRVEQLLAAAGPEPTDVVKREIVTLAKAHFLATPFTSLLVLENDRDVALLRDNESGHRALPPPPAPPPAPRAGSGRGGAHTTKAPTIRMATTMVTGRLPPEVIQREMRIHMGAFRACYQDGLLRNRELAGRVVLKFVIDRSGAVASAIDGGSEVKDRAVIDCMLAAVSKIQFTQPEGGVVTVVYPYTLDPHAPEPEPMRLATHLPTHSNPFTGMGMETSTPPSPWSKAYLLMRMHPESAPRTPIGLVTRGDALAVAGDAEGAARAYASLAELWPERTELLRAAAVRIDALSSPKLDGTPLATALLRRAVADRPDQPSSHHLLGLTLLRAGNKAGARAAFQAGLDRRYELRYRNATDVLRSDLELTTVVADDPRTQASLAWETDTSFVELSLTNASTAYSGIPLAQPADGFGPAEMAALADTTNVRVTMHQRGMGGDALGVVHVIKRNERGDVTVEPRPFAIMTEGAALDLGPL